MIINFPTYGRCRVKIIYENEKKYNRATILKIIGTDDSKFYNHNEGKFIDKVYMESIVKNHSNDQFSRFVGRKEVYKKLVAKYQLKHSDRRALFNAILKPSIQKLKRKYEKNNFKNRTNQEKV